MLSISDLKSGVYFILNGQPHEVLETHHLKMQQRRPVLQTRFRNLLNGKTLEQNFQQSDAFEEADIEKTKVKYLYNHRVEFWFSDQNDPSKRFKLEESIVEHVKNFLKANTVLEALKFNGDIINIELPVKMDFLVIESPPGIKGDTAQGGTKQVKIESGVTINVPLFINEGDTIRINTQIGQYTERVEKKK